ncbi:MULTISPECIES: cell division protein FtsX [Thioalkalivibrio]|uniref:cell division protein FtsX n=1 Tax=Thioalkalivibrio TaxID=106633 RepID=UPI00037E86DC|nr:MULTISPECIES: permease-like cell division protein FtsX [Thioalkalivibrio]OOC50315.1 cell division protein FtsX [Thioalkalivibrio versutus]
MKPGRRLQDTVPAWLEAHRDAARRSLQRRLQAPVLSLISIAVLGFILALPAYLWVLLDNARALSAHVDHDPRIALYLDGVEAATVADLERHLETDARVERWIWIDADEALARYREGLADPGLLDWLDENPLPDVVDVVPATADPETVAALREALAATVPGATVVSDDDWVRQLNSLHQLGLRILSVVGALLGLGALLILALATASELRERREEIAISRISGATHRFLRRPSLYGGVMTGLGGGIFAGILLLIGIGLSRAPLEQAAAAFDLELGLSLPGATHLLALLLAGLLLGWLGARLGSGHALRDAP